MCEKCVRVYSQHLHYILIKLIYSLLFSAPVSRNLKHSRLSGLGLSVFSLTCCDPDCILDEDGWISVRERSSAVFLDGRLI